MAHTVVPVLGVDLDGTPTTSAGFALGDKITANNGGVYEYVQAGSAITQYQVVGIDEDYKAFPLTKTLADDGYRIGFADQATAAADDYTWVRVAGGTTTITVLGSCAADVALYTTATAGALDDTAASQTLIEGVTITTTNSTTAAANIEAIVSWPRSGGLAA